MSPVATLVLGALNGHFLLFTLQIFRFCRHMWRCDHLPTSDKTTHISHYKIEDNLKTI